LPRRWNGLATIVLEARREATRAHPNLCRHIVVSIESCKARALLGLRRTGVGAARVQTVRGCLLRQATALRRASNLV
jgi:hypothetical protein